MKESGRTGSISAPTATADSTRKKLCDINQIPQLNPLSHYFKDVSKLNAIDVYRVLELFEVVDPAIQHAVKKLMCAGGRGHKDRSKDVQEAIDSLNRWQEMRKEDENEKA